MSMNYTGREPEISETDAEGVLFAANPVWDRSRKKRGFGARKAAPRVVETATVAPERRTFAPDTTATMTNSTLAAEDAPFAAAPVTTTRTTQVKRAGPSPTVIALALGAVVVLGGVGFYAMQPRDGVETLKPGEPTTTEVAAAPITPATPDVDVATNTLPQKATPAPAPAATPTRMARQSVAAPSPRVRPARAAAPSADANTANVSATLPDGPRPYSSVNPAAAPAVTAPAPTQVTPAAPAPAEAAPPPVQQAEPAPETVTPPTN